MYKYSLVSVFCSRHLLKFEIYIILCQILITVFFGVLKIKINLVKLTFWTAVSSHQVMGVISKKREVCKIYRAEIVLFLQLIG